VKNQTEMPWSFPPREGRKGANVFPTNQMPNPHNKKGNRRHRSGLVGKERHQNLIQGANPICERRGDSLHCPRYNSDYGRRIPREGVAERYKVLVDGEGASLEGQRGEFPGSRFCIAKGGNVVYGSTGKNEASLLLQTENSQTV